MYPFVGVKSPKKLNMQGHSLGVTERVWMLGKKEIGWLKKIYTEKDN